MRQGPDQDALICLNDDDDLRLDPYSFIGHQATGEQAERRIVLSITIKEPFGWADGNLIATPSSWKISFYLPGPDYRHKGSWFEVTQFEVREFIDKYKKAFDRYEVLKSITPHGSELSETHGDITIRVGSFYSGVCMRGYHNPISKRNELEDVVKLYNRVILERGPAFVQSAKELQEKSKIFK